jgi:hypothetical protein
MQSMRFILFIWLIFNSLTIYASECVVLLHGLARTSTSMNKIARTVEDNGYVVINVNYPSRKYPVEILAQQAVSAGLLSCKAEEAEPINFVTHSLGGILLRVFFQDEAVTELNRVVMLGPPNQGSEVVDRFQTMPGFKIFNGPAGLQLGTDATDVPKSLGPVNFELGVIAGNHSMNLLLSRFLPDPDDGKVSVASTRVDGMCAMVEMPVTHTMMMRNNKVIEQILSFLQEGKFTHQSAVHDLCKD